MNPSEHITTKASPVDFSVFGGKCMKGVFLVLKHCEKQFSDVYLFPKQLFADPSKDASQFDSWVKQIAVAINSDPARFRALLAN